MSNSPKKDFSMEWKDQQGGVSDFKLVVAKTQEEWEKMWNAAHGNMYPAPQAPKLPKGKMVLGLFMGNSNEPSDITVSKVEEKGGQTVVTWSEKKLESALCVMNDPFLLKWVDKTNTPVVFQEETPPRPSIPAQKFGF